MQTGSATAAAKQLGLTQPGISRLLACLEELVGFQLFYREHSRLVPTEEAKKLTPEINLLLSNTARFLELARNIHKTETGCLTVVAPSSFNSGPLVEAVASFIEKYPRVSISIDSHSPQVARDLVAQRSIDCGFIQLPENHPGLVSVPILRSPMVCALPTHSVLASKEIIQLNELADTPLIMLGQGRPTRQKIDLMFKAAKVHPQIRLETHSVATACAYVKRGLGVAILNQVLAQQYKDEKILLIPLEPIIEHQYGFIYSAYAPLPRLVQAFFKHCIEYFNEEKVTT